MGAIRKGVHPDLVGHFEHLGNAVVDADASQREVAAGDRLGEANRVRLDTPVFQSEHLAGTAEAGDDFVGNEEDRVLVADFADAAEVIVLRHDHASRPLHGLRQEHRHRLGPLAENGPFQLVGGRNPRAHAGRRLIAVRIG